MTTIEKIQKFREVDNFRKEPEKKRTGRHMAQKCSNGVCGVKRNGAR